MTDANAMRFETGGRKLSQQDDDAASEAAEPRPDGECDEQPSVTEAVPPALLATVSAEPGGRLVLVIGAGASIEAPTCLESGAAYAEQAHQGLMDDHVLAAGDCADPRDLSLVADAVHARTGSQEALTNHLPRLAWRLATPNDGHRAAAALLIEGALRAVITLNYDLAMQSALSELGGSPGVTVCRGPEDYAEVSGRTLFYLHRSAESPPEDWVLRSTDLESAWRNAWEELVASGNLSAPMTLFAGLGSPAAVLTETVARLAAIGHSRYFYADPYPENRFVLAISKSLEAVIKLGWCALMLEISGRVAAAQRQRLLTAGIRRCSELSLSDSTIRVGMRALSDLDLVALGRLRGVWLVDRRPYVPDADDHVRVRLADLVGAIGAIADVLGGEPLVAADYSVRIGSAANAVAFHCAHGGGVHSWAAVQENLRRRLRHTPGRANRSVLVGGITDLQDVLAPDLVRATDADDLIRGAETFVRLEVSEAHTLAASDPGQLTQRLAG